MNYVARFLMDTSDLEQGANRAVASIDRIFARGKDSQATGLNKYTQAISQMNTEAQGFVRQGVLKMVDGFQRVIRVNPELQRGFKVQVDNTKAIERAQNSLGRSVTAYERQQDRIARGARVGGAAQLNAAFRVRDAQAAVNAAMKLPTTVLRDWDTLSRAQVNRLGTQEQARYQLLRFTKDLENFGKTEFFTDKRLESMNSRIAGLAPVTKGTDSALKGMFGSITGMQQVLARADFETRQLQGSMRGVVPVGVDAAQVFLKLQSAAQGMMMGAGVAQGSIMSVGFSLLFLKYAMIPIVIAAAAVTAGFLLAAKAVSAFKQALDAASSVATDFEKRGQQLASFFQSAAKSMDVMRQSMSLGAQFGIDPNQVSVALQTLEKLGINQQKYRMAILDTAAATGVAIPEISADFESLYKTQYTGYQQLATAFYDFTKKYNVNLAIGANSAEAAFALERRYANAASDAANTHAGVLAQLAVAWQNVGIVIGTVYNSYLNPVVKLFTTFVKSIGLAFQNLAMQDKATGALTKSIGDFASAMNRLVPVAQAFGYFFGTVMYYAIRILSNIVKVAADAFTRFWSATKPVRDLIVNLVQDFKMIWDKAAAIVAKISEWTGINLTWGSVLGWLLNTILMPFKVILEGIYFAFKILDDVLRGDFAQAWRDLGEAVRVMTQTAFEPLKPIVQWLIDSLPKIAQNIGAKITIGLEWIGSGRAWGDISEWLGNAWDTIGRWVAPILPIIGKIIFGEKGYMYLTDMLEDINQIVHNYDIGPLLVKVALALGEGLGRAIFGNTFDFIEAVGKTILEHIPLGPILVKIKLVMGEKLEGIWNSVWEMLASWKKTFDDWGFMGLFVKLNFNIMGLGTVENIISALRWVADQIINFKWPTISIPFKFGIPDFGGALNAFSNMANSLFDGARAGGGSVGGGRAYLVGERGPEIFMPGTGGQIIPNGAGAGGGLNVYMDLRGALISNDNALSTLSEAVAAQLSQKLGLSHRMSLHRV